MPKRAVKVYAVEAIMKNNVKKGAFVRLQMSGQEHETTPIYSQISELKWNQSFTMKMGVGEAKTDRKNCPYIMGLFVNSEQTEHCSEIRSKKQNIKQMSTCSSLLPT